MDRRELLYGDGFFDLAFPRVSSALLIPNDDPITLDVVVETKPRPEITPEMSGPRNVYLHSSYRLNDYTPSAQKLVKRRDTMAPHIYGSLLAASNRPRNFPKPTVPGRVPQVLYHRFV